MTRRVCMYTRCHPNPMCVFVCVCVACVRVCVCV